VHGDQFDSTGVRFDPANNAEQRKTVTITAKAADNRSVGTATTTIDVIKQAVIAAIRLPDVLFQANSARVNNCGKRILLEQLRAYFERDSTGTVVLVGHSSSDETPANLAEQRALNAAAVITAGTGVCLAIPQSQCRSAHPAPSRMESPSRRDSVNPPWGQAHPALRTCGVSRCGSFPPAERYRPRLRTLKAPVLCPSAAWGARSRPRAGLSASRCAGYSCSFAMG
jgi:hypothetical protein